jgi:hydroxymethylbilane synthase
MRLGTRGSALALAQATAVANLLAPTHPADVVPITTSGDRGQRGGDKSRWVAELEDALARGEIDLAVHSAKDLPGELADGLELLGAPARASPEDVLCGAGSIEQLPAGAVVGTSSVRRLAQLRAAREDLNVVAMRGNVDTRLRRLEEGAGGLDAIVLARAGLERLGLVDRAGCSLAFVPAPGQGALALEGRRGDDAARDACGRITDLAASACLLAERALARSLEASCDTPLGAHAVTTSAGELLLRAWVGLPDGSEWICDELAGAREDPEGLGAALAERLRAVGASELLAQAG